MSVGKSVVYTLDMPKFVYIQVNGVPQAIRIRADKVTESGLGHDALLILNLGNEEVGKFKDGSVQGWWIQDEAEKT